MSDTDTSAKASELVRLVAISKDERRYTNTVTVGEDDL
jgi:hypothetical protein